MGLLGRKGKKKNEAVSDVHLSRAKSDAMRIVSLLHGSRYQCTMPWEELLVRFRRTVGCTESEAIERVEIAMGVLMRSQAVGWAGAGSEVCFSRSIPIVVV